MVMNRYRGSLDHFAKSETIVDPWMKLSILYFNYNVQEKIFLSLNGNFNFNCDPYSSYER